MEGAGRLGEWGWGGQTRAKKGLAQWQGEVPVSHLGKSLVHLPAPTSTLSHAGSDLCSDSPWLKRLPSGDFLPAQRDRRRLWLLCYLAGTHLHLLLSSQTRKHFLSTTSAGRDHPRQILQTRNKVRRQKQGRGAGGMENSFSTSRG